MSVPARACRRARGARPRPCRSCRRRSARAARAHRARGDRRRALAAGARRRARRMAAPTRSSRGRGSRQREAAEAARVRRGPRPTRDLAGPLARPSRRRGPPLGGRRRSRRCPSPSSSPSASWAPRSSSIPRASRRSRPECSPRRAGRDGPRFMLTLWTRTLFASTSRRPASIPRRSRSARRFPCARRPPAAHRRRNHRCPARPPTRATRRGPPRCPPLTRQRRRSRPSAPIASLAAQRWLFLATVGELLLHGVRQRGADAHGRRGRPAVHRGPARHPARSRVRPLHRRAPAQVDASLPFFIPLPLLSRRSAPWAPSSACASLIPTRRALLDIGASGPLAGLVVAMPSTRGAWRTRSSSPVDATAGHVIGARVPRSHAARSITSSRPTIPAGIDVSLSPVAFAAWAGMFVTMINLLPAEPARRRARRLLALRAAPERIAQWVHRSMLAFFFVSVASFLARDVRARHRAAPPRPAHRRTPLFWLVWFEVLAVIGTLSSRETAATALGASARARSARWGSRSWPRSFTTSTAPLVWIAWFVGLGRAPRHGGPLGRAAQARAPCSIIPPTGAQPLGLGRTVVAVVTLLLFVLLFMPTPISV